jgi:hypothetical protein
VARAGGIDRGLFERQAMEFAHISAAENLHNSGNKSWRPNQIGSISPGRQVLLNHGSSGP